MATDLPCSALPSETTLSAHVYQHLSQQSDHKWCLRMAAVWAHCGGETRDDGDAGSDDCFGWNMRDVLDGRARGKAL